MSWTLWSRKQQLLRINTSGANRQARTLVWFYMSTDYILRRWYDEENPTSFPPGGTKLTLEKHFLSCVSSTAFPEPGLQTRAISLRHEGYRSQFFFLDPILKATVALVNTDRQYHLDDRKRLPSKKKLYHLYRETSNKVVFYVNKTLNVSVALARLH